MSTKKTSWNSKTCEHGIVGLLNCKPCHKMRQYKYKIKHEYGITLDDWWDMWNNQDGRCSGCKTPFTLPWHREKHIGHFSREYVCLDHCHTTGNLRGLLCGKCNIVLGKAEDRIDILESLIEYLKEADDA